MDFSKFEVFSWFESSSLKYDLNFRDGDEAMNLGNQDWWMGPLCLGLAVTVGCGSEYIAVSTEGASTASFTETNHPIAEFQSTVDSPVKNGLDDANLMTSATANQRIIYSCVIGLVVEDYHQFESQLPNLIRKFGGFVASSDTDRQYKDQQRGVWVVRIPVQNYAGFLSGIGGIGFAESRSENATDVTEEYIDLEARIGNKQRLEDRIVKMLEERTGKLSEVLDIERELARMREEIERMQGRLRFLKDRSSMATVTLHCREQKEYVPAIVNLLKSTCITGETQNRKSGHLVSLPPLKHCCRRSQVVVPPVSKA